MRIKTQFPIAIDSNDHNHPRGTINDSTKSPEFLAACERLRGYGNCSLLDLECAGGGLVAQFADAGNRSLGIDGSDVNQKTKRAEWGGLWSHRLFTADITKHFQLVDSLGRPAKLEFVTLWEVFEHIREPDLPQLIENIKTHLSEHGICAASIQTKQDRSESGVEYHQTLQTKDWWVAYFANHGLCQMRDHGIKADDYPRGSGKILCTGIDVDYSETPDLGFHLAMIKS